MEVYCLVGKQNKIKDDEEGHHVTEKTSETKSFESIQLIILVYRYICIIDILYHNNIRIFESETLKTLFPRDTKSRNIT